MKKEISIQNVGPDGNKMGQNGAKKTTKMKPNWCQVEAKLMHFGTNLGPSSALLDQVGPCWGQDGTRVGQVGAQLDQVEAKFG